MSSTSSNYPVVSVIMATHNGAEHIQQAVASVLAQEYPKIEIIIVDDGSTDDTLLVLQSSFDRQLKYIRNAEQIGLAKSLNKGITEARGQYIARIDDDDIWNDPFKLSKQVAFLEAHPDVGLVGTQAQLLSADGEPLRDVQYPVTDQDLRRTMLYRNQFVHSSVIIPRHVLTVVGRYDERIIYAQDYELWLRIGVRYQIANIPESCVHVRQGRQTTSSQNRLSQYYSFVSSAMRYRSVYPGFYTFLPVYGKEFMLNMVRSLHILF